MRPTIQEWAMEMAIVTAKRSTCLRRSVGSILLDMSGHVLSTGYNGVARGLPHCNEELTRRVVDHGVTGYTVDRPNACSGSEAPSGTDLDSCQAIHAEQNALLQCRDVYQIYQCIVTTSPCMTCMKLLLNTGCQVIVFLEEYPNSDKVRKLWQDANREWINCSEYLK